MEKLFIQLKRKCNSRSKLLTYSYIYAFDYEEERTRYIDKNTILIEYKNGDYKIIE